jgi:hypothetical protein
MPERRMKERDDKLTDSMLSGESENYRFYSVGRTEILRRLGNPYFLSVREMGDWTAEELIGTAWVVFRRKPDIAGELIKRDKPRDAFREIWENEMHPREVDPLWEWLLEEEGLTEAAMTVVGKERGKPAGKDQPEPVQAG